MAKLALKLRDQKRRQTVEKFKAKRTALLEIINDARASDEAREEARMKLQKLPRVRDFRGVSDRAFDGRGNFNFGIKEQIIFPEIDFDAVDAMRGMDIAITTTAKTDAEAKALLEAFSFPFRN